MGKIYLGRHGDKNNVIEIDENVLKLTIFGYKNWFTKRQIDAVRLVSIHSIATILTSIILGIMGAIIVCSGKVIGLIFIIFGGVIFYSGMEWNQRLEVTLLTGEKIMITFFYCKTEDIRDMLKKYGYSK